MSSFRVERECVAFCSKTKGKPAPAGGTDGRPRCDAADRKKEEEIARKQEQAERASARAEQLLEDAKKESGEIREQARQEALRIAAEASEQAKGLREEEKARGYADGKKASEEEVGKWKEQERERFDSLTRQMKDEYDSKVDAIQSDVTELVMEITEKIIGVKLEESDEAFLHVVNSAMSRFRQSEEITVHLSGEDFHRYSGSIEKTDEARGRSVSLNRDPSLRRGECVLESEAEFVDCGVPGQLDRARALLKEEQEKEESGYEGRHAAKVQGSLAEE